MKLVLAVTALLIAALGALVLDAGPQVLVGLFAVLALIAAIRRPILLLGMTLASALVSIDLLDEQIVTPYKLALVLLALVVATLLLRRRTVLPLPSDFMVLGALYFAGMIIIDIFLAIEPPMVVEFLGTAVVIFAASQLIRGPQELLRLGSMAFVGAIAAGMWIAVEKPPWLLTSGIVRAAGPAGDPNSSAVLLAMLGFLAFPWVRRLRGLPQLVAAAALLASVVYGVFATASRGATVAAMAGIVVLALVMRRSFRARVSSVAVALTVFGLAAAVAPSSFVQRMDRTVQTDAAGNTVVEDSSRSVINRLAVQMIVESPVVGHGSGVFERRAGQVIGISYVVHNIVLRVAVAYGLPMAILYTLFYLLPLWRGWQLIRVADVDVRSIASALLAAAVTAFIFGMTNARLYRPLPFFVLASLSLLWQRVSATSPPGRASAAPQPQPWRGTGVQPELS